MDLYLHQNLSNKIYPTNSLNKIWAFSLLVEGIFCKGRREIYWIWLRNLTLCFPLSTKWRGGVKGERLRDYFYPYRKRERA